MDVMKALLKRRSVRRFLDTKVEKDKINKMLEAAMASPSACNAQPWEFLVIEDEGMLGRVREIMPYGKFRAPLAILVCGNLARKTTVYEDSEDFWIQDTAAAMHGLMLEAVELGLASCWLGILPHKSLVKDTIDLFDLPEGVIPMGMAYIGYPEKEPVERTQYNEEFVHWERY